MRKKGLLPQAQPLRPSKHGFTMKMEQVLRESHPIKFMESKTTTKGKSNVSEINYCLRYCLGIDHQYLDPLTLVTPGRRLNLRQQYYNNIVAIRVRNPKIQPHLIPLGGSWYLPPLAAKEWLRDKLLATAWSKGQCNCITLIQRTAKQYFDPGFCKDL